MSTLLKLFANNWTIANLTKCVTWILKAHFVRRKQNLACLFFVVREFYYLAVWQCVLVLLLTGFFNRIWAYCAIFLFQGLYQFKLCCRIEINSALSQQIPQMFSNVSSSKVDSFARVSQSVAFVNWHNMCNSVAWIQNNTCGLSSGKSSINLSFTKRERPELRQRQLALGTFQKIFQAFSFCALSGSYWLQ